MNFKKLNFKLILVILYLIILSIGLYYLFSVIDLKDLNDYEFYKSNQDLVYKFKDKNFIFSVIIFLIGVITDVTSQVKGYLISRNYEGLKNP